MCKYTGLMDPLNPFSIILLPNTLQSFDKQDNV